MLVRLRRKDAAAGGAGGNSQSALVAGFAFVGNQPVAFPSHNCGRMGRLRIVNFSPGHRRGRGFCLPLVALRLSRPGDRIHPHYDRSKPSQPRGSPGRQQSCASRRRACASALHYAMDTRPTMRQAAGTHLPTVPRSGTIRRCRVKPRPPRNRPQTAPLTDMLRPPGVRYFGTRLVSSDSSVIGRRPLAIAIHF